MVRQMNIRHNLRGVPDSQTTMEKEIWGVKVRSLVIFPREEKAHGLTQSSGGAELKTIINL